MDVGGGEQGGDGVVGYGDDFYGGKGRRLERAVGVGEEEREVVCAGEGEAFAHGHEHGGVVGGLSG